MGSGSEKNSYGSTTPTHPTFMKLALLNYYFQNLPKMPIGIQMFATISSKDHLKSLQHDLHILHSAKSYQGRKRHGTRLINTFNHARDLIRAPVPWYGRVPVSKKMQTLLRFLTLKAATRLCHHGTGTGIMHI
jgi:hypothetical protein